MMQIQRKLVSSFVAMTTKTTKPSILELMQKRPVIGDGSYMITLEKRGYAGVGLWTPEAVIEYPEAGVSLW